MASLPGYGESLLPILPEDEVGRASVAPIPDDRGRSVGEVLPRDVGNTVGEALSGDAGCTFIRTTDPDFADDGREFFSADSGCDSGQSISNVSAGQRTCQLVVKGKSGREFLIARLLLCAFVGICM